MTPAPLDPTGAGAGPAPMSTSALRAAGHAEGGLTRSIALSTGVHAAVVSCAFLVAFGFSPGQGPVESDARLVMAEAPAEVEWEPPDPELDEPLELPEEPEADVMPVEDPPLEPFEIDERPDVVLDDRLVWERVGHEPIPKVEFVPPPPPVEPTPPQPVEAAAPAPPPRGADRALALLESPSPAYPRLSLRLQEEGTVTVRIEVDATGRVLRVEVVESSRFPRLDAAAIAAVEGWVFRPALSNGVPVPDSLVHKVTFRLSARR